MKASETVTDGPPEVIPYTPPLAPADPEIAWVVHTERGGAWSTAVARKGITGYCGLCPRESCNLTEGVCLQVYPGYISEDDAPTYSFLLGRPLTAADHLRPGKATRQV